MKRYYYLLVAAFIFVAVAKTTQAQNSPVKGSAQTLSLSECYALALKQSETLAVNKDLIAEAEARFIQALGGILPHVSVSSSDTLQDKSGLTSMRNTAFNSAYSFERKLVVKQALFSGFKEFAGMAGSRLEKSQRANEFKRAKQLLWADVTSAFYLLLQQEQEFNELGNTKSALEDRIKELQERVRVGRSRKSEIVNTQVQLFSLVAQIETVKSQKQAAHELLEFLTGTSILEIQKTDAILPSLLDTEYYLAQSQGRFDILALKDALDISQRQIQITRSGLWPSASLEGDYFLMRNTSPTDSHWSALLSVSLPIFQGTETYGQIAQAKLQAHESQLLLQRGKRVSRSDVLTAYILADAEITRCKALKRAMDAADENYQLQSEDYRLNLVSNLDVLTAIQARNDARQNYIQSFYEAKQLYENLLVAAGIVALDKSL